MPRSPTNTARFSPKRSRSLPTCAAAVEGSDAFPGNASTATGRPSASHSRPNSICGSPVLPSREYPFFTSEQIRLQLQTEGKS